MTLRSTPSNSTPNQCPSKTNTHMHILLENQLWSFLGCVEQTSSFKRWRMIIVCCHIQLNMPQRCPNPCLLVPLSSALIDGPCQDSPIETNTFQPHCSLLVPWPIPLFLDQYVLMDSHSRDGYCVHCHYGTGSVRGQLALHGSDSFLCLWLHSRTLLSVWLRVIFQRFLHWAAPSVLLIRKRNGIGGGLGKEKGNLIPKARSRRYSVAYEPKGLGDTYVQYWFC